MINIMFSDLLMCRWTIEHFPVVLNGNVIPCFGSSCMKSLFDPFPAMECNISWWAAREYNISWWAARECSISWWGGSSKMAWSTFLSLKETRCPSKYHPANHIACRFVTAWVAFQGLSTVTQATHVTEISSDLWHSPELCNQIQWSQTSLVLCCLSVSIKLNFYNIWVSFVSRDSSPGNSSS